jgi:NitT/TauT family transport system substrate-binding protein
MSPRAWRLHLAGPAALAILLTACGSAPAASQGGQAPPDKLTVAFSSISGDNLSLWIAKEAKILEKNRLDVEVLSIAGGKNAMAALLSGQLQLVHVGGSEVLSAVAEGADLAILATPTPVYPYVFMVAPNIKSVNDLKQRKVGVSSKGGSADIATRKLLQREGLDPDKDVIMIALGSHQERTAALLSGAIQAGVDDPPGTGKLEAKGLHALYDLAALKLPAAHNVIAVQRAWAKDHRDIVQRYIDSIVQAVAIAKKDRAQTVSVFKKYFKSEDEKELGQAADFFTKEVLPSLPYPQPEQFVDAKTVLGRKNEKVRNLDVASILDPSFVKSAATRKLDK